MAYYSDQSTVYRDVVLLLLLLCCLSPSSPASVHLFSGLTSLQAICSCIKGLQQTSRKNSCRNLRRCPLWCLEGTSNRQSHLPLARRTDETVRAEADYFFLRRIIIYDLRQDFIIYVRKVTIYNARPLSGLNDQERALWMTNTFGRRMKTSS